VNEQAQVLGELLALATYYGARQAQPGSRLYADLDVNGADILEFVVEVERRYSVDLSSVCPRDARAEPQDPTLKSLAEDVLLQRH
jgi:hypothetical protein